MKQLKKLLVMGIAVTAVVSMAGCGTSEGQAESEKAVVTEKGEQAEEPVLEVAGMDGERIQGQGFTIAAMENWHEAEGGLAEGFLGLKSDTYNSTLTMHIEAGPAYTDMARFESELADATGLKADTKGKAACGEYLIVDVPAMEYTEADLKAAIDAGSITQADVDNAGGMDAAVEMVNSQQASQYQMYVPYKENSMFSITGSYDENEKEDIKAAMIQVVESVDIEDK